MNGLFAAVCAAALGAAVPATAQVYRWVDEAGRVHYTDQPPPGQRAQPLRLPPARPAAAASAGAGPGGGQAPGPPASAAAASPAPGRAVRSESAQTLGPLPDTSTSEWARTLATSIAYDTRLPNRTRFQFSMSLRMRQDVPVGTFLEARFENPVDAAQPLLTTATVVMKGSVKMIDLFLLSPQVGAIGCRNYRVVVQIFRSEQDRSLLGTHRQTIQSRVDSGQLHAAGERGVERVLSGRPLCPG